MITSNDLRQLSSAVETRNAIEDARHRQIYGADSYMPKPVPGARYSLESTNKSVPLYTPDGQFFAGSALKKELATFIDSEVREGSIIEYKDEKGKYYYGEVQKSNEPNQKKIVKPLSVEEVAQARDGNPDLRIYSLGQKDVKKVEDSKALLSKVMNLLDPGENLFFKIVTAILLGEILESTNLTDIFMQIYVRLVFLAFLIISISIVFSYFVPS